MVGFEPTLVLCSTTTTWQAAALPVCVTFERFGTLSYILVASTVMRCPHVCTAVLAYHAGAGGASIRAYLPFSVMRLSSLLSGPDDLSALSRSNCSFRDSTPRRAFCARARR